MNCPKCKSPMEEVTFGQVKIDRCTSCRGIWFDEFELTDLKEIEGSETVDTGDSKTGKELNKIDRINCPKCNTQMIRMVDARQSHIWFEHCVTCSGHFFDAGEFRDLKEDSLLDFIKSWFTAERITPPTAWPSSSDSKESN